MMGARTYVWACSSLAAAVALLCALPFLSKGTETLLFVALGWAPIALVGVAGGALAVKFHGTPGMAFPGTLLACILLRLIFGLGGLFPAMTGGRVTPYLVALFGTFTAMQAFEMIWFLRRARHFRAAASPAR